MKTNEIRQKYLEFFQLKGHKLCPSDVLVPTWDPSVLFTPAGMNQFKDHFLGKVKLEFTRATSCQTCLRTGDIDNVGRTAYHHTFFEMLGNFSFGDYFKREAIHWAWEFLTDKRWLAIDPNRLTVTVYLDDDEAYDIWNKEIGLAASRITRMDEYDNFWPAGAPTEGPDGVCGPCSEIFFHPDSGKEVEIWNLVFTQFNRQGAPPNNLVPLPSKNIDTGMGLERIAATMQGVETNYHIDILRPIVDAVADVCSKQYDPSSDDGRRMRRITDHIRACTFCVHENVYPGANKERYVVKRLLRRAVLDGHQMGMREPFLYRLVPAVVEAMREPYPELLDTADRVARGIKAEEEQFLATLDVGLERIEAIFASLNQSHTKIVPGNEAFDLYQTHGVPPELFEQIASERDASFDWDGYHAAEQKHKEVSNTFGKIVMGDFGPLDQIKKRVQSTEFVGYESLTADTEISGIITTQTIGETNSERGPVGGEPSEIEVEKLHERTPGEADTAMSQIVLARTPFYAESGGQVGDTGKIIGPRGVFHVVDTQKAGDLIVHYGFVEHGRVDRGDAVTASVDTERREAIQRAHSATHVLHAELQAELGKHAQQRGSKVTDDWLRFDFTNQQAVSEEQLQLIESRCAERLDEQAEIRAQVLPIAEAKKLGAMMLFGEKYPDPVRMVSIGAFSKELCGGTHLRNTREIIAMELVSEENISAGTRRIVALTGHKAKEHAHLTIKTADRAAELLGCAVNELPEFVHQLSNNLKAIRKLIAAGGGSFSLQRLAKGKHTTKESLDYPAVRSKLRDAARMLNVKPFELAQRLESMLAEFAVCQQELEKQADSPKVSVESLIAAAETVDDTKLIVAEIPNGSPDLLRRLIDQIRKSEQRAAVFLATAIGSDKVILVAGLSRELVERGLSAGEWVKQVSPLVGGGGGGKPDLAQAGGKQPENIQKALESAKEYFSAAIKLMLR
ncbi:MAG TPA: alanine--tRNA ligase [Pirellulaceae bacterium]|nr:alanine--tRNA ligase [Pirellulaceae bacterium]HMO91032.1 alanine--tRNA ligase [Pirellulaceae bacterium]HMP68147.1 alanine--tRNA ligase [Pirellulaceae bacterium]